MLLQSKKNFIYTLLLLVGGNIFSAELKKEAEKMELTAQNNGKKRKYSPEQEVELKKGEELLNLLIADESWPKKRNVIRDLIAQHKIHPDDILFSNGNALVHAVRSNDKTLVTYLLTQNANPNVQTAYGTALEAANNVDIAQLLIANRADPNFGNRNILTISMDTRAPELTLLYFCNGADPKKAPGGYSALSELIYFSSNSFVASEGTLASFFVRIGVPLDTRVSEGAHTGATYRELLNKNETIPQQEKIKILKTIESAQKEVEQAKKVQSERDAGLATALQKVITIPALAALIASYDDPIILPDSLVREIEEFQQKQAKTVAESAKGDSGFFCMVC